MDCFIITAPILLIMLGLAVHTGKRSVRANVEKYVDIHISRFDPDSSSYNRGTADALLSLKDSIKKRKLIFDWQSKGEI